MALSATIFTTVFDIAAESRRLKENPEKFETIRNEYRYREEYF